MEMNIEISKKILGAVEHRLRQFCPPENWKDKEFRIGVLDDIANERVTENLILEVEMEIEGAFEQIAT